MTAPASLVGFVKRHFKTAADRELLDAAECFVEQYLFTGLTDGECDYAIGILLKAYRDRKYPNPDTLEEI